LFSSDRRLAARLEAAEAANAFALSRVVEDAEAEEIAGGCAVFAGVGSFLTHALGIGMAGEVTAAEFDRLEEFYRCRGGPCLIDLCPLADLSCLEQVFQRGYKVIELNNILARPVRLYEPPAPARVRRIGPASRETWSRVVAQGFAGSDEITPLLDQALGRMPLAGESFLAESGGEAAGGGGLGLRNGVALFYADGIRPAFRRRGLQQELIAARLHFASEAGCDLAMVTVLPGSDSHRNYERAGFRLAYMRVNVARDA
jgi:GNAT superfamily N-acetyltransferase